MENTSGSVGATVVTDAESSRSLRSYVDWPAIIAGVVTTWAITSVLATFGSGIGLTMTGAPWDPNMSAGWFLAAGALWFIWVQISSVMAGGYLAGRLRHRFTDATEHEIEMRDGAHGLLVWGASVLVGAVVAISAVSGGISAVTNNTAAVAGSNIDRGPVDSAVERLFRPVITSDASAVRGRSPAASAAARNDVGRIVALAVPEGEIANSDKQYIARLVAVHTGLPQAGARARVDGPLAATVSDMQAAAETARKTGIIAAFLTAATLLVSGIAGWWAAGVGGRHRDENVDLVKWFRFR